MSRPFKSVSGEASLATGRLVAVALLLGVLASCGGGGGTGDGTGGGGTGGSGTQQCRLSLTSQADGSGAGTDGGGGPGPGGGGGAGDGGGDGGAGLGQIRNASVSIEQADGETAGPVALDNTTGLVRFVLCGYTGPVKFTVTAANNGSYFDEGSGVDVPFTGEIHAVIPTYTKNVGFTTLTEAAYQLVVAKYGADGWRDPAQVTEANNAVRDVINRALPVGMQIDDITRLPQFVNSASGAGALTATQNGLLGTLNAGLAKAARFFNLSDPTPALTLARQFGLDLSDGQLDGFWVDKSSGAPTVKSVVQGTESPTYTYAQFAEFLNSGVSQGSSAYGDDANQSAVLKITQVKVVSRFERFIKSTSPMFLLADDGSVYYWGRPDQPLVRYATGFKQLFPMSTMLGSTYDGKVYFDPNLSWSPTQLALPFEQRFPDQVGPLVEATDYNGATVIAGEPDLADPAFGQVTRLQDGIAYVDKADNPGAPYRSGHLASTGLRDVVTVAAGANGGTGTAYFALVSSGNVFAWKGAGIGLGLGLPRGTEAPSLPTLNPFLKEIVSITGRYFGGFAIDRNGKVWGWGIAGEPGGLLEKDAEAPVEVTALTQFGPMAQISCGGYLQCIAMTRAGEAIAWGAFFVAETDPNPGVILTATKVALPAGRRLVYVGSLNLSSFGLLDDGTVMTFPTTPEKRLLQEPGKVERVTTRSVGGTISGLTAGGLVLAGGTDALPVPAGATSFTMPTPVAIGSVYNIAVLTQPAGLSCLVANGTGSMPFGNVANVRVLCAPSSVAETALHSFAGGSGDGSGPEGSLIRASDGNFYGTTSLGGASNRGTIFRLTPAGALTVLHSFTGSFSVRTGDGFEPNGGLIQASDGNLYGTTRWGGLSDFGTVFRISLSGAYAVLRSFARDAGGGDPLGGLVQAADGNLYGTTSGGGTYSRGTVFRVVTTSGATTVLYSFGGVANDGAGPTTSLIRASDGNLYGTTTGGGAFGYGTIFRITTSGTLTQLYSFAAIGASSGGDKGLVQASDGNLYGMTSRGGANDRGTVFRMSLGGTVSTLYDFDSVSNTPAGNLVQASDGNLYGVTSCGDNNNGTVFKISLSGAASLHYLFGLGGTGDGRCPSGGLIQGSDDALYGMTSAGGAHNAGTVFRLTLK